MRWITATEMTLGVSFLIGMILFLRKILQKKWNPNIRYFLWLFVALRILVPVKVEIVLPSNQFTEKLQAILPQEGAAEEQSVPNTLLQTDAEHVDAENQGAVHLPLEPGGKYVSETLPWTPAQQRTVTGVEKEGAQMGKSIFGVIWLCGAIGLSGYILVKNGRLYQRIKGSRRQVEVLENGLCLYEAEGMNCLLGCFHPAIYVSSEVLQEEKLKAHVLMHELQHYGVKDHVWVLVRTLCLIVQWYNPLVWVAYMEVGKDCELACDYRVTKEMNKTDRVAYGESLLTVVGLNGNRKQMYLATSMGEDKQFFAKRLEEIMKNTSRKRLWLPCIILLVAVVLLFSSMTFTKKGDAEKEDSPLIQNQENINPEELDISSSLEGEEEVFIQRFPQEDVMVIPEIPQYTYEEASALGTVAEYRDILPGAAEGSWYVTEIDGIEYYYGKYDGQEEMQPQLMGAGYAIVGDNYALANGLKVGMTEEEVLQRFPNMAVRDFEGNDIYQKVKGCAGWNMSHYPESEEWLEGGQNYRWTDQFDYIMIGDIDLGTEDTLPIHVGLFVKDKVIKAITFDCPTAG